MNTVPCSTANTQHSVGRLIWDISHGANGCFEGWRVHVRGHRNVDLYVVCNAAPQSEVDICRHVPCFSAHTESAIAAMDKTGSAGVLQVDSRDPDDLNWDFALIMYLGKKISKRFQKAKPGELTEMLSQHRPSDSIRDRE